MEYRNQFTDIFKTSIQRINDDVDDEKVQRLLEDIKPEPSMAEEPGEGDS